MDVDGVHKVNHAKVKSSLSAANGRGVGKKKIQEEDLESVDCICLKGEDGSPMILCSECRIWCVISLFPPFFLLFSLRRRT